MILFSLESCPGPLVYSLFLYSQMQGDEESVLDDAIDYIKYLKLQLKVISYVCIVTFKDVLG